MSIKQYQKVPSLYLCTSLSQGLIFEINTKDLCRSETFCQIKFAGSYQIYCQNFALRLFFDPAPVEVFFLECTLLHSCLE